MRNCRCGNVRCVQCFPEDNIAILKYYQCLQDVNSTTQVKLALMDLSLSALVLLDLQVSPISNTMPGINDPGEYKFLITREIARRLQIARLEEISR